MIEIEPRSPRTDHLIPQLADRVKMTVSCRDCDPVPKVANGGDITTVDGRAVQIMHNGLLVELGGYLGPWTDEIIFALRGHHEPQEELVYHAIIERLRESGDAQLMIELGSNWTYYGMWFAKSLPSARVVGIEPDPAFLELGRRNAALNALENRIHFVHGLIASSPGDEIAFTAESDGNQYPVVAYDLDSLLAHVDADHVDLVLADIQGAETIFLERAQALLKARRVRFMVVSTHHHWISGSATTHQDALELLRSLGAHVIAEHTISESFSGDGLIAVSFDPRDADLRIELSHARAQDSLFGGLEPELGRVLDQLATAEAAIARLQSELELAAADLGTARSDAAAAAVSAAAARARARRSEQRRQSAVAAKRELRAELSAVKGSQSWRVARRIGRLRSRIDRVLRSVPRRAS